MGKHLLEITADLRSFIEKQPIFFVGSAPLDSNGHVNVSPKGLDTFRVIDEKHVAYLDLTGSGNETAAHIAENHRLTIMFCAFSGRPEIVRLYCLGTVVTRNSPDWESVRSLFPEYDGVRQVILGEVRSVQTSCGYAVPEMTLKQQRDTLCKWIEKKTEEELVDYRSRKNRTSLDGLNAPPTD